MAGLKTISEQVYQTLYEEITSGQLQQGEKLTLKMIQNRLGVSSSPIREALTRLSDDGLISYQPNIGMTVISLSKNDASEIFALAREFDSMALRFAWAAGARDDLIAQLKHVQQDAAAALESGRQDEWLLLSDEFHNVIFRHCGNSRLMDAAEKSRKQISVLSHLYQQDAVNMREIQKEHDEILAALEEGDIRHADKLMRAHLDSSGRKGLALFD
ncbi:MAG: GntR family transcriptional regulator [Eubacteriaceae bacterium]|jgi:Transcriptional regulators|nr:GntR family transcriptional regulator [Eubacteriaceae bacterium]